jgi:hypothetical protein
MPKPKPLPATQEHVYRLEESIDRFVTNVGIEFNKLYNAQTRNEAEFREFKDEMDRDRQESRAERREMNRKWGELANKLGTMVEDLVYPSLPRVLQETFGHDFDSIHARVRVRQPDGWMKEFDAYAICADLAALNSTKATLRSADVDRMVEEIAAFRQLLPAHAHLPVVGILATLAVDESVLNYAERMGFLVLAVGDQVMEVKNRPGFEPKRW